MTASRLQITPQRRALLDTIRLAEGTWADGKEDGYGIMFGGGRFDWRKGHPDRVVRTSGYASAAAGAYQFLPTTWNEIQGRRGFDPKDFSPAAQDDAALALVQRRGALEQFDKEGLSAAVLNKLSPEWASLPKLDGASYHGQPVKKRDELMKFYGQRLAALQANGGSTPAPAPATGGSQPASAPASGGSQPAPAPAKPDATPAGLSWQDRLAMDSLMNSLTTPLTKVSMPFDQLKGFAQDLMGTGQRKPPAAVEPTRSVDPMRILKMLGIGLLG